MRKLWLLILFILVIAGCKPAADRRPAEAPSPVPGAFYIDPAIDLGPISPLVYGTNYGPWVALPFEMFPDAEAAGLTVVRFPGGEWGDQNSLRSYQLDQGFAFAGQLGAELTIHVRLRNGTPEEAAELVRYVNIEKGYGVRYWAIGNEPSLYEGYMDTEGHYGTERFNREWRAFAEAMRAVDSSILLIGPEVHQFPGTFETSPKDFAGNDWVIEFLKANGDMLDVLSVHRYPFPTSNAGPNASVADLRADTQRWDGMIAYLKSLGPLYAGRDIPVAVTEVNSHYSKAISGEGTPDSFFNAIWWGDVLGRMIRGGVLMVNHWMLTSKSSQGGWGLIGPGELRPAYHVYRMYAGLGDELVYASSDDPFVTVTAALRPDGALTVMLTNLTDAAVEKSLVIAGRGAFTAEQTLFDESHLAEEITRSELASGETIVVPARAMLLLVIR